MLPELIYREEESDNFPLLFIMGSLSAFAGFTAAYFLFPAEVAVLSVIFASIPLVYPLTRKFLADEKDSGNFVEEVKIYTSLFAGQVLGFTIISLVRPDALQLQAEVAGVSGRAVSQGLFMEIFTNNMAVFGGILAVAAIIGSAGTFILVWNASVLGKFFASLLSRLEGIEMLTGTPQAASPIAYVPHATLEMTGFIVAGITGSLVSAAVYRRHYDQDTWINLAKLVLIGLALILAGAIVESS